MKRIKGIFVLLFVFIIIAIIQLPVQAVESFQTQLTASNIEIKKGEQVEITLNFKDYEEINKGINAYKATLEYDSNLFEKVKTTSFKSLNSWEEFLYNSENNEFIAIKKAGSKTDEAILTLVLKAKENVSPKDTIIKVKDIVASEGKKDIYVNDSQVEIQVIKEQESQKPNVPIDTEDPDTEQNNNNNIPNDDIANGKLPQTGLNPMHTFILIIIELLVIIAIVAYIKMKKLDKKINKKTKMFITILSVGIITTQLVGTIYAVSEKGELNDDGEINYKDVSLLEQHLIDLNKLPDDKLQNADMNSDNKLTVTDLSLLVQKIEKTLDYEVNITSNMDNYYPEKNDEIELKFTAIVSYGAKIEEVTINGENYKVENEPDTSNYFVKIKAQDKSGIQEFKFSKVKLNVGKEVKVDYIEKIDVLKDKPSIENYQIEEIIEDAKLKVLFEVKDNDNSLISAKIQLYEGNTDTNPIKEESIEAGKNEIILDLDEDKEYTLDICLNYNLDTDELVEHEQDNTGILVISKELKLNIDYKFNFNNIKLYNENGEEVQAYSKNEQIILGFSSTNATKFLPKYIVINGNTYEVSNKENDKYEVKIDAINQTGEYELKIEKVILENGKTFIIENNNIVNIKVQKEKPEVQNVSIEELTNGIQIAFNIKDTDNTITNKKLIIENANGVSIFEKEIQNNEFNEVCQIPNDLTTKYVIKIVADYDITTDNSNQQKSQILYEKELTAKASAIIKNVTVSKTQLEKNEDVTLNYEIETNISSDIEKLVVNNIEAIATKKQDNTYVVTIPVGNNAGKENLELTKVILKDGTKIDVNNVQEVEVLKSIPVVENYAGEDDYDNSKVNLHFDLKDEDNSFISGYVQLVTKDNQIKEKQDITATGNLQFSLSVVEKEEYTFQVVLTYTRDEGKTEVINDKVILEKPIQMIVNYELNISDIQTKKEKAEEETKYFSRDEKIKVIFTSTNATKFVPERAQINGKEYELVNIGNNKYETLIDAITNVGLAEIKIEKVWMNNAKELEVQNDNVAQIEILKVAPTVSNFGYEETGDGKVTVKFEIVDLENAMTNAKVVITDTNKVICEKDGLTEGKNEVTFDLTSSEEYIVKILADYDLDEDAIETGANEYKDVELTKKEILVSQELMELKDILSVQLYTMGNSTVEEVTQIDVNDFDASKYIAKVSMKELPVFYAEIEEGIVEEGKFRLILKYDNVVQYDGDTKTNKVKVTFGEVSDGIVNNLKFEEIIEIISKNPTAEINLTNDLDAKNVTVSTATYLQDFKGTINANGHTIKNLSKPLFNKLENAEIKNLIIEDSKVSGNSSGILANQAIETEINNVHIIDSTIETWHVNGTGGFVGIAESNTIIENCSANNLKVNGSKRIGGFTGYLNSNSEINNSYIRGLIIASSDAVGGLVGQSSGAIKIQNTYEDVEMQMTNSHANAGIIGYASGNNVTLINNISLADGQLGTRVIGTTTTYTKDSKNNYEIEESELASNSNNNQIKTISKNDINEEFFKDTLKWDEKIWTLDNVNIDKLPTLKNSDPYDDSNIKESIKAENEEVYIPNIARLRKMSNYDTSREIAYHNMNLLMPFYNANLFVEYGNRIDANDILNKQKIKMIIPYNKDDKMIVGLNTNNYDDISRIRVIFEDEQIRDYTVEFKKKLSDIATYKIKELDIRYVYNQFIMNTQIATIDEIIDMAKNLDYKTQIQLVTPEEESRIYVDYYNEYAKNELEQAIMYLISNEPEYNLYLDNEILKQKIKQDITGGTQLEKIIYTYNYFDKWYNMEIGGISLTDLVLFNVHNINNEKTIMDLVNATISQGENARKTNNSVGFFNNVIKSELGDKNIGEFIEYFIKILTVYDNPSDWFTSNFKGMIKETPIEGKDVRYRAWEMMKVRNHLILPIMSMPNQEEMYIVSVPSQILIGSLNRYNDYVSGNIKMMQQAIDKYSEYIGNFYEVSSNFIKDADDILNKHVHIQYDTRFGFVNTGSQYAGTTQDPVIKWVYEVMGTMPAENGTGAYANGTDVYWVANAALVRGTYSFKIFTHETAHNQDGYYFYEGNGRRSGTDGEDHADANIAQDLGDGSVVFNIREDLPVTADDSNNLKLDSINGTDEIYNYYKEMFETYYVLDYLTGQAFLQLSPEEQAKVAVQVNYQAETNYEDGGAGVTYKKITAEEFKKMQLKNMEGLWDNGIALRGTGTVPGSGSYGGDTHYSIYWYQPHNNNGRPDSYTFKRLGFEMLGVGGYSDGYVTYRSVKSKNDLDALRKITNNDTITWKQYKMNRYKIVEQNLSNIPYFNAQDVIETYKQALQKDAQNGNLNNVNAVRRTLYGAIKRATKDFTTGNIYSAGTEIEISSAQQFIDVLNSAEWGNYKLVNDLDFSNINITENAYITNVFVGRINGNGYKIKGLKATLFNSITYAEIQDLTIEKPEYTAEETAIIADTSKNSILNNIVVNDSNINLPFAKTISGTLQILGNTKINVKNNEISTVEDLLEISNPENPLNKKKVYELKNNIDVGSITGVDAIITGTFEGTINGNGYTISNLKVPLISILTGNINNLNIENVEIIKSGANNLAPIAGESRGATISDIKINNVTIEGRDNISAVVGIAKSNTTLNRISATNINIKALHYYAGGVIGRSYDSKLKDILVTGRLEVADTHNGGVIGALNRDTIENVYAAVDVVRVREGDSRNKNAGLYGAIEAGAISVKNVIVAGNMSDTLYKVTPATTEGEINNIASYLKNVYEYENSTGINNSDVSDVIKKATSDNLKDMNFYITTMGWSEDIWDFSNVTSGDIPKIK